jgi:hypothetical protein
MRPGQPASPRPPEGPRGRRHPRARPELPANPRPPSAGPHRDPQPCSRGVRAVTRPRSSLPPQRRPRSLSSAPVSSTRSARASPTWHAVDPARGLSRASAELAIVSLSGSSPHAAPGQDPEEQPWCPTAAEGPPPIGPAGQASAAVHCRDCGHLSPRLGAGASRAPRGT